MKLKLLRLFLPILVLIFVLPMIVPGPDGEPVMGLDDWLPSTAPIKASVEKLRPKEPTVLFKWQDENGQWHFSDKPVDSAKQLIKTEVPDLVNTMEPLESGSNDKESVSVGLKVPEGFQFSPTTVPLQDIPELIDEAKKARAMLEQRGKELEDI